MFDKGVFMSIRMIAIDLDGTLLHDDMTISAYSRSVIRRALAGGFKIVVATGRMWDSAKIKVDLLDLGNVPVICYTGSWIMMSETGEPVLQQGLDPELASRILYFAKEKGWGTTIFMNDQIYMEKPDGTEIKYQKYRSKKPQFLGDQFFHPHRLVTRVIFADPVIEKRMIIRKAIEEKFGNEVDIVFPGDDFVDVHKKGVNKAQAVRYLCEKEGIGPQEILAFGNTENDVPLLRYAGHSFAVANADKVAKEAAKGICLSNEEDGVAKEIEKLLS